MLSVAPPQVGSQKAVDPRHQPSMASKRPGKMFRCDYVHTMARTNHLSLMEYVGLGPCLTRGQSHEEKGTVPQERLSYNSTHGEDPATDLCSGSSVLCPALSPPGLSPHWEPCRKTLPPSNPEGPPGLLINGPFAPITSTHATATQEVATHLVAVL